MKASELATLLQRVPGEAEVRLRFGGPDKPSIPLAEAVLVFPTTPITIDPKASFAEQAAAHVQLVFTSVTPEPFEMHRILAGEHP
jgi:hypothetical protein